MTPLLLTLLILALTLFLFVTDWLRLDLVALMMLVALIIFGILEPQEALAGFADPVVIMIAGLFVIGGAITQTGTAQALGTVVMRLGGKQEWRLTLMLMLTVALLSAFMSSTGTLAIFLPIAIALARQAQIPLSRLLMPMAFAALVGGMLTLIGTPPNLVVSTALAQAGHPAFGFFDFLIPGSAALALVVIYILTLGRWLLPAEYKATKPQLETSVSVPELLQTYQLKEQLEWFTLPAGCALFGQPLAVLDLANEHGVQALCSRQHHRLREDSFHFCRGETELEPHQDILVMGSSKKLRDFANRFGLVALRSQHERDQIGNRYLGLAEVLLLPRAKLIGRTLAEFRFRDRYRLHVLAIQRNGKLLTEDLAEIPLRFSDILLVQGPWRRLERLQLERDLTVLNLPPEVEKSHVDPFKIGLTLAWLALMLGCMLFNWLPLVGAILLSAVGLVLTRCLSPEDAYRSISWESVVLIAAMLPMATALQNTGGTAWLTEWLSQTLGALGPYSIMATLFILTSGFSLFMSNTATTVLIAPIALQLSENLGFSPQTCLMVVALAASSAFATPMSSPVNTMVLGPGGYRFMDYVRVGLPLQILMLAVALLVVPRVFGL